MNEPSLPNPIELETLVRTAAFQLLLTHGESVAPELRAQAIGISAERLGRVLDELDQAGRIRRDAQGSVFGSAGLSVTPDRHEIEIGSRRFWTWCAYDIFGIFGALGASGRAISPSPFDGKAVEVRFVGGRPQAVDAVLFRPDTALMDCCQNVYEEWCPNSNLFASRQLAEGWAASHGISGRVLDLDEAADLATEDWKAMTEAKVSLRSDAR